MMSNGTDIITFRDPEDFSVNREIRVTLNGAPVKEINELEWIDGSIWANVWRTPKVVRIDPSSGKVTGELDCRGMLSYSERSGVEDVQNGIASNGEKGILFLTGKNWPYIYKIQIVERGK